MGPALFALGLLALVLAIQVHAPIRRPGELAALLFAPAWLAGELPLHAALLFLIPGCVLAALGALDSPLGLTGLVALLGSLGGHVASWRAATVARAELARALGRPVHGRLPLWRFALPFVFGDPHVEARPGILREGEHLRADLYLPRAPATAPRRLLVYVHGGGWVLGFRRFQGRLLMRRLVCDGWVCVSIQYRLSPRATWPAHIVDVQRALAWVRSRAPTWSADPSRVAISGNSAGGHLATLAGLTDGLTDWTESGPTRPDAPRVSAIVSWYGIYDLVGAFERGGDWPHRALARLWRLLVMKRSLAVARDAYRAASPVSHLAADAPPLLLIHGTHDSLVPIATARAFARHCEAIAPGRATLLEVRGAQHAFDVFTSRRGLDAVEAAALWLDAQVPRAGTAPVVGA
ncbi:MAG: alpha/beta hydrolase [Deltaproteobacteria bacterium]|nr:alpha/beta hydrolase [Deltaproteobacteria bacterium]